MDASPESSGSTGWAQAFLPSNPRWVYPIEALEGPPLPKYSVRACVEPHGPEKALWEYSLLKSRSIQIIIHTLICQQFRMRSLLDDLPIMDNDDLVGINNRRKTMGDYK